MSVADIKRAVLYLILLSFTLICVHQSQESANPLPQAKKELPSGPFKLFIRAFKQEQILETWIKTKDETSYSLHRSYPICQSSGQLGPKRKEGDEQVPEGVYKIDRFNPNSAYHLSLGLNYPNRSDRIRGDQHRPGSDIFLHGKCITIGCIPLTDPLIEEVYELATLAKERGQASIYVHIFPGRMDTEAFEKLQATSKAKTFWKELLPIYLAFEQEKEIPYVLIDEAGKYSVRQ